MYPSASYYIPAGAVRGAWLSAGAKPIEFCEESDRHQRKQLRCDTKPRSAHFIRPRNLMGRFLVRSRQMDAALHPKGSAI